MKISIIGGGGRVGSNAAFAFQCASIVSEIHILDANEQMAAGEALDLIHGTSVSGDQKIYAGNYEKCSDSDVVVITAGLRRKPDESRLDLINRNVTLFKQILDSLKGAGMKKDAIIFVVSNPVDILTRLAIDFLKWDPAKVIGLGTQLDTARFRSLIALETGLPPSQIKALILGEHGDSMVPIWSTATAGGIPLVKFNGFNGTVQQRVFERTKTSGAEAIKLKGGAGWAVGLTIAEVVHTIALNQPKVLPVSTQLTGEYGIKGTCTSLPTLIDRRGVVKRYEIELWPREASGIVGGAKQLDQTYAQVQKQVAAMKSLDQKIANIRANPSGAKDFILADAKDADMATGLAATGKDPVTGKARSLAEYRDQMREIVRQGLVDIMLMSASTSEVLTIRERLFDNSHITPAARANDTTDIHLPAGGTYAAEPSRPFQSTTIDHIQAGKIDPTPEERKRGANLGLYSITPNNNLEFDYVTLQAYKDFRLEAERKGFRHFLEVFDPNACGNACPTDLGRFINDLIVRTLAGVPSSGRPVFLKIAYHGPRAMEELVSYDPSLVPGILGGSSGTTYDAFRLLEEAKQHGARAALFGRKINNSEHQLTFVTYLRAIADGKIGAAEAVKAYHGDLERLKIKPQRPLKDDLGATTQATSYAGTGSAVKPSFTSTPTPTTTATAVKPRPKVTMSAAAPSFPRRGQAPAAAAPAPAHVSTNGGFPRKADGTPDFSKMNSVQKVAFARQRIQNDMSRHNGDGDARR